MIWLPFICLGIGLVIGLRNLSVRIIKATDIVITITLVVLMLTIGANIGVNDSVMSNLGAIGINCAAISISAIFFSVIATVLVEKTILPLEELSRRLYADKLSINNEVNITEEENKKTSPLIWIMPISIMTGVIFGYFIIPQDMIFVLSYSLRVSLIVLYIGVGMSLGANRKVFSYIKLLGWKIVFLSIAIFAGSIIGGFVAGTLLGVPYNVSLISASGMSYYSITGAYMTQAYGIEAGTYGFIVNVMREFFTVLLLPLLMKISKGSPIAGGAAGDMDTMLVPITKFVGPELGLVTLITGTILTFAVPFILPLLYHLFS